MIRRSGTGTFPQYYIQNGFHGISCTCCVVEKSDTRLNVTWVVVYHKKSKHIHCSTLWWYYFCTKETREHVSVHRQQGIYQCQLWTSRFKHHHQILHYALMVLYYERQTRIQHPITCYEMCFPVSFLLFTTRSAAIDVGNLIQIPVIKFPINDICVVVMEVLFELGRLWGGACGLESDLRQTII